MSPWITSCTSVKIYSKEPSLDNPNNLFDSNEIARARLSRRVFLLSSTKIRDSIEKSYAVYIGRFIHCSSSFKKTSPSSSAFGPTRDILTDS
jgi:hypothetical protein